MDGFRAAIRTAMTGIGWAEPLWLETSQMTQVSGGPAKPSGQASTWFWPAGVTGR
jgi:hypothetical protein